MSTMELVQNRIGQVRFITENGREYAVAPLTMIVPGVLPGSKGPLLYQAKTVANRHTAWNGIPITLNHPTHEDGSPVSASAPGVVERVGMGVVKNARIKDSKLCALGYFDMERTKKVSPEVYNALRAGKVIELSTGLFTRNETRNGMHQGKPYIGEVVDMTPDHLAVLPHSKGACSVNDGCGVMVDNANQETDVVEGFWTWLRGFITNQGRHPKTGKYQGVAARAAEAGFDADADPSKEGESILDEGDGDTEGEDSELVELENKDKEKCPECGGKMVDGECEDCGYEEDDNEETRNAWSDAAREAAAAARKASATAKAATAKAHEATGGRNTKAYKQYTNRPAMGPAPAFPDHDSAAMSAIHSDSASSRSESITDKSSRKFSRQEHKDIAYQHKEAAKHAEKAGNSKAAKLHSLAAELHTTAADHYKAPSKGTNNEWSDAARAAAAAARRASSKAGKASEATPSEYSKDLSHRAVEASKVAVKGKSADEHRTASLRHIAASAWHRDLGRRTSGAHPEASKAHFAAADAHDAAGFKHLQTESKIRAKVLPALNEAEEVENAWSDAAREAAAAARKGTRVALRASGKIPSQHGDASKAFDHSIMATAHTMDMKAKGASPAERASAHSKAAESHMDAASLHEEQAHVQSQKGNAKGAKLHSEAATAHLQAASMHHSASAAHKAEPVHNEEEVDMSFNRAAAMAQLTTNCECWKGAEKALNSMTDEQLKHLVKNAGDMDDDEDDEEGKGKKGKKAPPEPTKNAYEQFLEHAPKEVKELIANGLKASKDAVIAKLVANVDKSKRAEAVKSLNEKDLATLNAMVEGLAMAPKVPDRMQPSYVGLGGYGPAFNTPDTEVTNEADQDEDDILDLPSMDLAEISNAQRKAAAHN